MKLPAFHGAMAEAAAGRKPVIVEGPPAEFLSGLTPRYLEDVRSTLVAPLIVDEKVIGVVALCSSTPQSFNQNQAWFLSLITGKLASTVTSCRALQELRLDAATDPLTNLPNVRLTFENLEKEIDRADREGASLAVLFMDLDRFKLINDSYGHAAGDRLLIETAQRLRTHLRAYDFLGRMGGDEFLAILTDIEPESLEAKVKSLKQGVAKNPVTIAEGVQVTMTISIGMACYPQDGTDAEELIHRSDEAMYLEKRKAVKQPLGIPGSIPAQASHEAVPVT